MCVQGRLLGCLLRERINMSPNPDDDHLERARDLLESEETDPTLMEEDDLFGLESDDELGLRLVRAAILVLWHA